MKFFKITLIAILGVLFSACRSTDPALESVRAKYDQLNRESPFVTMNGVPVAQKIRFIKEEEKQELLPENQQLKQIALIRHGEPDLHKAGRFSFEEARDYMVNYDTVGILQPDEPFFMVGEEEDILFYTSTLERARATAQFLFGPEREFVETADFREFERRADPRQLRIKLPLRYWTVAARIEWMLGLRRDGLESFSEAKDRARNGALRLDADSREHDKVVLVAHGFLNRYIKSYLEDEGWEVVRDGGRSYFATTILAKVEELPEEPEKRKEDSSKDDSSKDDSSVSQLDD